MTDVDKDVLLKASPELRAAPGDFGVRLNEAGDALEVPEQIMTVLGYNNTRSALEFVSLVHSFNGSYSQLLGWKSEEVAEATEKLVAYLIEKDVVRPDFFRYEPVEHCCGHHSPKPSGP